MFSFPFLLLLGISGIPESLSSLELAVLAPQAGDAQDELVHLQ